MSESVRSMTGFGSATFDVQGARYRIDLRSVNHRNLNIRFHMPGDFASAEGEVKRILRDVVMRGSIDVSLTLEDRVNAPVEVSIDREAAKTLKVALDTLSEELQCESVSMNTLLRYGDFLKLHSAAIDPEELCVGLYDGLKRALDGLEESRRLEGQALALDLESRLKRIEGLLDHIESAGPAIYEAFEIKLRQRVEEALASISKPLDEGRIANELVLFSDRCDVTEETVRARAHVKAFRSLLKGNIPEGEVLMGKRCEFLTQELGREFNTIGSKCRDSAMSAQVVTAKVELERIREQVHNIA